jgi:hypothetical protein
MLVEGPIETTSFKIFFVYLLPVGLDTPRPRKSIGAGEPGLLDQQSTLLRPLVFPKKTLKVFCTV